MYTKLSCNILNSILHKKETKHDTRIKTLKANLQEIKKIYTPKQRM